MTNCVPGNHLTCDSPWPCHADLTRLLNVGMRNVVEKASHCAWQIHYHIVFPVKYRRGLLDEAVVKIIMMTAKEIED